MIPPKYTTGYLKETSEKWIFRDYQQVKWSFTSFLGHGILREYRWARIDDSRVHKASRTGRETLGADKLDGALTIGRCEARNIQATLLVPDFSLPTGKFISGFIVKTYR